MRKALVVVGVLAFVLLPIGWLLNGVWAENMAKLKHAPVPSNAPPAAVVKPLSVKEGMITTTMVYRVMNVGSKIVDPTDPAWRQQLAYEDGYREGYRFAVVQMVKLAKEPLSKTPDQMWDEAYADRVKKSAEYKACCTP